MIASINSGSYRQPIPFDVLSSTTLKNVDQMGSGLLAHLETVGEERSTLDLAGSLITQAIVVSNLTSRLIQRVVPLNACADLIEFFLEPFLEGAKNAEKPYACLHAARKILHWHSTNNKDIEISKKDILLDQWIESARSTYNLWVLTAIPLFSTEELQNIHFDREYAQKTTFDYKVTVLANLLAFKVPALRKRTTQHIDPLTNRKWTTSWETRDQVMRLKIMVNYLNDLFDKYFTALDDPSHRNNKNDIRLVIEKMFEEFILQDTDNTQYKKTAWYARYSSSLAAEDLRNIFFRILSTHDNEQLRNAWIEEFQKMINFFD